MSSQAAELVEGLGWEVPSPGTVESWLLDTMDLQLAYRTVRIAAWHGTSVVVVLQSMLKQTPLLMPLDMESLLRGQPFIAHIFRALAVLN